MANTFKKIFQEGIQRRPFKAHKRYEVTDVNHSSSFEISILRGISPNGLLTEVSKSISGENVFDPFLLTGSRAATSELNDIPQPIVWRSLNSSLYKNDGRHLYPTASIVSIPQNKFGEGIKPGSVVVQDNSIGSTIRLTDIQSDNGVGKLIDTHISSSYILSQDCIFCLGFQNGVINKPWNVINDDSTRLHSIVTSNLQTTHGIETTGNVTSSGYAITSGISSSMLVHNKEYFNVFNKTDDWSVSFWVRLPENQPHTSNGYNTLISKRFVEYTTLTDSRRYNPTPIYPFDIGVYNSGASDGKLYFNVSNGFHQINLTSSAINDNEWYHVLARKSGSTYDLFLDGVSVDTEEYSFTGSIHNSYDIMMMSNKHTNYVGTSGSLDEVRMYKGTLSDTDVFNLSNNDYLSGSAYQTQHAGYVFYQQGMIVVSDPRPKYSNIFLGNGAFDYTSKPFQLDFRATKNVEEISILCEINRDEFNVSTNPSLRLNEDLNESRLKPVVETAEFRPYVTQIGLYNDFGELLAIAKLASPLKKRQDVDVTINVKFDID